MNAADNASGALVDIYLEMSTIGDELRQRKRTSRLLSLPEEDKGIFFWNVSNTDTKNDLERVLIDSCVFVLNQTCNH